MRCIKRAIAFLLAVSILYTMFLSVLQVSAKTVLPTKTINLVYDDSGSMIRNDDTGYVDTWCQAKYAMEVFAAMLGEKDTLNIYYMSDYTTGTDAPPKISLSGGKEEAITKSNVAQIHDTITDASSTPFQAVEKAYSDLAATTTDEKWLVVLTDGEFNETSNSKVENYLHQCVSDGITKTIMFAMGPNAASISADENNNIFFYKAENTQDIPSKLTKVCNQIFQNNALKIEKNKVTFNVPMSELTVFAQGKDVSIGNITTSKGKEISPNANVKVMYSTDATIDKNYKKSSVKVADNLTGYVAKFTTDFEPGTYEFDIKGAETVEVYYKPNVTIAAYLYDKDNEEVTKKKKLVSGNYRLEFGFLSGIDGKPIEDTSLLGDIKYKSKITNKCVDGKANKFDAKSGDSVTIKQGTLDIDVTAKFLKYNTVNTKLSYDVYSHDDLIFTFEKKPDYVLTVDGFKNAKDPIVVKVKIDTGTGPEELTKKQWELLGTAEIASKVGLCDFEIEKTDKIGVFNIYPKLIDGDPYKTNGGSTDLTISGEFLDGDSSADGSATTKVTIKDQISKIDRIKNWLKKNGLKLLFWILLLLLILGYIPPFKKYFSKKIKKRPLINCTAQKIGQKDITESGSFQKNIISTFIPYKAETGKVIFSKTPRKTAELKAGKGNRLFVTNVKAFAGKSEIKFDGMTLEKGRNKPYPISAMSSISTATSDYVNTCYLD